MVTGIFLNVFFVGQESVVEIGWETFKRKRSIYIRGFHKGRLVASVEFYHLKDGCYRVRMIAVNKKFQRQGIGTHMMKKGMEFSNRLEAGCLPDVLPFYEKLDFQIKRKTKNGYEVFWTRKT
jgi:GNAT superfamily N-acetyltransferase